MVLTLFARATYDYLYIPFEVRLLPNLFTKLARL